LEKAKLAEERAIFLDADFANAHIQLATVQARRGQKDADKEHLLKALALDPGNQTASKNMEALEQIRIEPQPLAPPASAKAPVQAANDLVLPVQNPVAAVASKTVANHEFEPAKPNSAPEAAVQQANAQKAAAIAALPINVPIGLGDGEFAFDCLGKMAPPAVSSVAEVIDVNSALQDALTAFRSGKADLARKLITEVLKIDPQNELACASYGALQGERGELDSEVEWERKAITLDPADPIAHLNLGWALARQGKWTDALAAYSKAVNLDPGLLEAQLGLGLAQMHTDRSTIARATLTENCQRFKDEAKPHLALSLCYAKAGDYGQAQAELQKAIDRHSEGEEALERVGAQELANENWQKAAEIYSQVLRKYPQDGQAWLGLGLSLEKTQSKQKALNCMRKAVELAPKDSLFHMALALAYETRGRVPEAELELQEAMRLNPEYRVAAAQIGSASLAAHP
jgi:tetratricopeptide (TPR) repeat protein